MTRGRRTFWIGLGTMVAASVLYALTLTPGVPPTDSGELALAAWIAGVPHAPGFPTYTIIGWLWSHMLPFGRVIWRLNLLSALCGAGAAATVYLLVRSSWRDRWSADAARPQMSAAAAALAFAVGRTTWSWSTVTEVYALSTLLVAVVLAITMRIGVMEAPKNPRSKLASASGGVGYRWLLACAALLFGLGLGVHLTSTALLTPAIAVWLVTRHGRRILRVENLLILAGALLMGLSTYLYLPWRAASEPLLNWGDPTTLQRFWSHVTASQYRVSLWSSPVLPQIAYAARLWWWQFTPVGLALLGWGAWQMARHERARAAFLGLVILFTLIYAWSYVIEDDQDAYYLPGFVAGSVWVGWGLQDVGERLARRLPRRFLWQAAAPPVALLLLLFATNWAPCDRHRDTVPEDYVWDVLEECEAGSVVLTRDWQFYGPSLYLQGVEKLRSDVTIIDTELVRRGWYLDYLARADGELTAAAEEEQLRYMVLRDAWESGELAAGDAGIAELQAAYLALVNAWMNQADLAGRAVHIGPNRGAEGLRGNTLRGQLDMEPGIGTTYQWAPVGLTFRAEKPGVPLSEMPPLEWRLAPFSQVWLTAPERKIATTRADMAVLRGMYHMSQGWRDSAERDSRAALEIDPEHEVAMQLLAQLAAASR